MSCDKCGLVPLDEKLCNALINSLERVHHHQVSEEIWRVKEFLTQCGIPSHALPSPLTCTHANEVPSVCKCPENCYCKRNTCVPSPALTLEEISSWLKNIHWVELNIMQLAQALYNRLKGEK